MWIGTGVGQTAIAANTKVFVSQLSAGAKLLRPFTILRNHIDVLWESDQEITDEAPLAGYGKIVVTEAAAGVGVTALPDPSGISGDPEADWFVWQSLSVSFRIESAIGFSANAGYHYAIDSKSMRKVGPDDDVVTVCSSDNGVGAILYTGGRMLVQLH